MRFLLVLMVVIMAGCSVNKVQTVGNNSYVATVRDVNYYVAREKAIASANTHCMTRGGGIEYIRVEQPYDNIGAAYYLYFSCFDRAAREALERERQEAQRREQERQRLIRAEEERKQQIEWEKRSKQLEAEYAKQRERERIRLNKICPMYWFARQTCATAFNYQNCMEIRIGRTYSTYDDSACRARR